MAMRMSLSVSKSDSSQLSGVIGDIGEVGKLSMLETPLDKCTLAKRSPDTQMRAKQLYA